MKPGNEALHSPVRYAIAIMGPTGSGKSDIAVNLADALRGEIISADSRQIYKHMPISTAQPAAWQLKMIRHYFIAELMPDESFSAGEFAGKASAVIHDCFARSVQPLIAGGSGLYLRALTDGFYEGEISSGEVREYLNQLLKDKGKQHLYEMLAKFDPESASITTSDYTRRVFRALEIYLITGKKKSDIVTNNKIPDFRTVKFFISYPRAELYNRINKRVLNMIEKGLLREVKELMDLGFHYSRNNSVNTVGIKEVMVYLEGKTSYDEMIETVQMNSRRYAKRQLTWLRKEKGLNVIDVQKYLNDTEERVITAVTEEILETLSFLTT